MNTRKNIAIRHYYFGWLAGVGVAFVDDIPTVPALGWALVAAGVAAQVVMQIRATVDDSRAARSRRAAS